MTAPVNRSRRRLLAGLAGGAAALAAAPLRAAPQPVVVLTAYQDEVVTRFEAAFEKAHPEYRLQMIWRMPHDALPYLRQPGQSGVDVYWSASPRTFAALARDGALRPLDIDRSGLPAAVGNAPLADPAGYYTATEMAGYGFALNRKALAERQLPEPADWRALADPRYAGLIALPSPARVGFAPPLVEIVLQAYGWEAGWALWSEIAGNAALVDRGSTFVTEEVASGRRPVGLSIDFFTASAIANGAPLVFRYPDHSGINPAHIAITAGAPNPRGARAFVEFVLSNEGQRLLAHADIRKLPVRPSAYEALPADYFRPFAAAEKGVFDYRADAGQARQGLSAALFHQFLVAPHDELVGLWARVHRAEAAGKSVAAARQALSTPPLTQAQANETALQRQFNTRVEGEGDRPLTPEESAWQSFAAARREIARHSLEGAGA